MDFIYKTVMSKILMYFGYISCIMQVFVLTVTQNLMWTDVGVNLVIPYLIKMHTIMKLRDIFLYYFSFSFLFQELV